MKRIENRFWARREYPEKYLWSATLKQTFVFVIYFDPKKKLDI